MHQSSKLLKLASTHGGMRKILKRKLPVVEFIKKAVEAGVHESLHQPQQPGGRNPSSDSKIHKYPVEYEILSLNPPMPLPPMHTAKELRQRKKPEDPIEKYTKAYMRRYDARMRCEREITNAEREEFLYRKNLGIESVGGPRAVDMNTAMGLKSPVLKHAYDFAIKQYEVVSNNRGMTEDESIDAVEKLLAEEEKIERTEVREKAKTIVAEKEDIQARAKAKEGKAAAAVAAAAASKSSAAPPKATIPSILHNKPRTIQALTIWGQRLAAVPYNEWTIGASTALDHWIACDVLGMSEESWDRLLDGETDQDMNESSGMHMTIGDQARMKDIVSVRTTFFPETAISNQVEPEDEEMDVDDDDSTERSIDELLASLGGFDEDKADKPVLEKSSGVDQDTKIDHMIETLQDWRARNQEKPFAAWDEDTKTEFNSWLSEYISLVTTESDGQVDIDATRDALLADEPKTREESELMWSRLQDETEAEVFLHNLTLKDAPTVNENETDSAKNARVALQAFLALPHSTQLRQLVNLGTLRPIFDEYTKESDRLKFMEHYGNMLLENMELEHLVPDPEGAISVDDIGDDSLIVKGDRESNIKFSIKKLKYGTDEFGASRSERARALYRAWNSQKAGRARYEEKMFKKGELPLGVNK